MRNPVDFIPILTTLLAIPFTWVLVQHYRKRNPGPHIAWWAFGVAMYGVGTLTEASVTLLGWSPFLMKSWYIAGALLGGAPLAQGTVYLMMSRKRANQLSTVLVLVVLIAATAVVMSPIDRTLVEQYHLTGRVLTWQWVRAFSPFINLYALIFLVGGAAVSAYRYWGTPTMRHRAIGNTFIALGALLPGIGGSFTRFGYTEVLYVTELIGIILIWIGYKTVRDGITWIRRESNLAGSGLANDPTNATGVPTGS